MAQWLRSLTSLLEDPGLIPGTHMVAHNCPAPRGILRPVRALGKLVVDRCAYRQNAHHRIKIKVGVVVVFKKRNA